MLLKNNPANKIDIYTQTIGNKANIELRLYQIANENFCK